MLVRENPKSKEKFKSEQQNKVSDSATTATTKDEKNGSKRSSAASFMIEFFIKIGVTVLIAVLLCVFVVGVFVKHDNSSYPMIKDGDLCLTFRLAKLSEGDEIVYKQDGKIRFGRIVAHGGDVVDVTADGNITVNGYGVYEDAVYPTTSEGASIAFPYTVPEGTYFVLNDYRDDINDSRTFGGISKSDMKGKIILVLRLRGI